MIIIIPALRRFTIQLIILTILVTTAGLFLFNAVLQEYYFRGFPILPLLFFSITLAVHIHLLRISQNDITKFTPRFLGTTGIKMILYFVLIVVFILIDRKHSVQFLVCFLALYFIYTTFEVISVLKYLKNRG